MALLKCNLHKSHCHLADLRGTRLAKRGKMAQQQNNLMNLFAELNKYGQQGEYERALKTSNKSKLWFL